MRNKIIPWIHKGSDPFFWLLWNQANSTILERDNFHYQGNFQISNNKPICPYCNSKRWKPKFKGSLDVGFELVYFCDCGKSKLRIWNKEGMETLYGK